MRIMLISPPNTLDKPLVEEMSFENRITPLDLAIIGAVLEKEGHQVKILDALACRMKLPQILKEIKDFAPNIVCITAFDRCRWGIDVADELSKEIKLDKSITLGLLWSFKPDLMSSLMKQSPGIAFSICGDPEFTLLDIANGRKFSTIKGLIYREGSKIIVNPPREPIQDLDVLPIPARHLLNLSLYKRLPHELIKEPCYDLAASRGCPYKCIFCLLNVVWGNQWRIRSPKKIIEEIKLLVSEGAKQIHFQDLTFTLDRKWVVELCELIINENIDITWDCQTRVDKVDIELLQLMKKAGCKSILYGIESLNQIALDKIKKGVTIEAVEQALKNTKKAGIETRCSMMLGLPGETKESVKKTIALLLKWNPAFVQFHTTIAFPGTELYTDIKKYGRIAGNKMVRKLDLTGNPFVPYGYNNEEELLKMQRQAYLKFYLRPRYLFNKALNIKHFQRNMQGLALFFKLTRK